MHMQLEHEPSATGFNAEVAALIPMSAVQGPPGLPLAALAARLSLLWGIGVQDDAVMEEVMEMDAEKAADGRQQRGTAQGASARDSGGRAGAGGRRGAPRRAMLQPRPGSRMPYVHVGAGRTNCL